MVIRVRILILRKRLLHDFFFEVKPDRFMKMKGSDSSYLDYALFLNVINSQISINPNQKVGNCFGLTSLYNVFLDRMKINHKYVECVFFDNNWAHGMSGIDVGDDLILVETCYKNGFDTSPKRAALHGNTFFLLRNSNVLVHDNYRLRSEDALTNNNFGEALRLDMEAEKVGTLGWYRLLQYGHFRELYVPGYENIVEFVP